MKILLVDDHALIHDALRHILEQLEDNVVILEAGNGANALDLVSRHADLDLVLLDRDMQGTDLLSVLSKLRERFAAIRVVVLSASAEPSDVIGALDHGAKGYIPKTCSSQVLLNALHLVLLGETYIPPEFLARSGSQTAIPKATAEYGGSWNRSGPGTPIQLSLTQRQTQVFELLAQGKSNKTIARELGLAVGTVKAHVSAILRALSVINRTQAVIAAGEDAEVLPFALRGAQAFTLSKVDGVNGDAHQRVNM